LFRAANIGLLLGKVVATGLASRFADFGTTTASGTYPAIAVGNEPNHTQQSVANQPDDNNKCHPKSLADIRSVVAKLLRSGAVIWVSLNSSDNPHDHQYVPDEDYPSRFTPVWSLNCHFVSVCRVSKFNNKGGVKCQV